MPIKMTVAAFVLTLLPGFAVAMGCQGGEHSSQQAAISCADGTMWDAEAEACMPIVSG